MLLTLLEGRRGGPLLAYVEVSVASSKLRSCCMEMRRKVSAYTPLSSVATRLLHGRPTGTGMKSEREQ